MDGLIDGAGVVTRISAWISHILDQPRRWPRTVRGRRGDVRGALLRRFQTGLLQNYALAMIAGVFVLLATYLMLTSAIP